MRKARSEERGASRGKRRKSPSLSRGNRRSAVPRLRSGTPNIVVTTLGEMRAFAERLAASLKGGDVIALMGPLGAGKTAFTQFLGRALGVRERITSPTFTLMHVHGTGGRRSAVGGRRIRYLVHIDAYRLAGAKALRAIGALDYLGAPDTVAVVEWAERVRSALPKTARKIRITPRTDGTRVIMMETGKRKSGKRTIGKKNG